MHGVFLAIPPNGFSNSVLQFGRYSMLRCVHVGHFGPAESFGKAFPGRRLDAVGLSNIETPNLAFGVLENAQKMQYLLITHSFIKVLFSTAKQVVRDMNHSTPQLATRILT